MNRASGVKTYKINVNTFTKVITLTAFREYFVDRITAESEGVSARPEVRKRRLTACRQTNDPDGKSALPERCPVDVEGVEGVLSKHYTRGCTESRRSVRGRRFGEEDIIDVRE